MILLESVSAYKNTYEFDLFEESDELDFSEAKAKIFVFFVPSVNDRLPSLLLILVKEQGEYPISDEELQAEIFREIIIPEEFKNHIIKVVRE